MELGIRSLTRPPEVRPWTSWRVPVDSDLVRRPDTWLLDRKFGSPTVTKDGVSVAKEIELEDAIENMGAQMVKEVATKTSDLAGDGTTTATVLAQAIFAEGLKNVTAGTNPMGIKRGIDKAVEKVVAELKSISMENRTGKNGRQIGPKKVV